MNIIKKLSNKKTKLSDSVTGYIEDDTNMTYLFGLMTGAVTLAGLTYIVEGEYLSGSGGLTMSYLLNRAANHYKHDMGEKTIQI